MVAFEADDLKAFTAGLFMQDTFDGFLLQEASVTTFCTFSVDGRTSHGFFSDEELEEEKIEEYAAWKKARPFCFEMIRGKKLPVSFKIILRLSPKDTEKLIAGGSGPADLSASSCFFLNIKYENGKLSCISMASSNTFTRDRTVEHIWDEYAGKFFPAHGIAVRKI